MFDHEPTVRSRYLGHELLRAAQKAGHNSSEMATLLGWSPSKVSRLLSGKRRMSTEDVSAFLALCRVIGAPRTELLALAANSHDAIWWQDHGDRPPVHNPALVDNEAHAVRLTCFGDAIVPDLLQVPDYTRALLTARSNIPDNEVDERVTATVQRQKILDPIVDPPEEPLASPISLTVIVNEYALTRTGAGHAVMSDQAHHLLRLAVRPDITIRIVPDTCEVLDIAPFTLLEFTRHQPVIVLEDATWTAFLERPETITAYRDVIATLDQRALDETTSRQRIADIAQSQANRASEPAKTASSPMPVKTINAPANR